MDHPASILYARAGRRRRRIHKWAGSTLPAHLRSRRIATVRPTSAQVAFLRYSLSPVGRDADDQSHVRRPAGHHPPTRRGALPSPACWRRTPSGCPVRAPHESRRAPVRTTSASAHVPPALAPTQPSRPRCRLPASPSAPPSCAAAWNRAAPVSPAGTCRAPGERSFARRRSASRPETTRAPDAPASLGPSLHARLVLHVRPVPARLRMARRA